ncbi:MAG: pyruvate dehydrogenase (acetyl-transferring), homodimeric type, partial [Pseudomonadota bacterium]
AMLPIYIYYSMFGFQRVGDLIWAAADQRARGFLIGATSGRTTLGGEGLQHQDGSSHLAAATVPNCRAYDPCYAYEVAILTAHGLKRMMEEQADEFFYLTVGNESGPNPSAPPGAAEGVVKGMHRLRGAAAEAALGPVRLLGAGAILREVEAAAEMLAQDWGVASEVFSVTSFSELERDARAAERANRLSLGGPRAVSHVERLLPGAAPVIAASDYVRAVPHLIAPYLDAPFTALGTDGFGRSDTRAKLRAFFEVDRRHVAVAALDQLARQGAAPRALVADAIAAYAVDPDAPPPWTV